MRIQFAEYSPSDFYDRPSPALIEPFGRKTLGLRCSRSDFYRADSDAIVENWAQTLPIVSNITSDRPACRSESMEALSRSSDEVLHSSLVLQHGAERESRSKHRRRAPPAGVRHVSGPPLASPARPVGSQHHRFLTGRNNRGREASENRVVKSASSARENS